MLVGLLANSLLGWWCVDPVIALVIAGLAVREGQEAWAGEGCSCAKVPGLEEPAGGCHEECCH